MKLKQKNFLNKKEAIDLLENGYGLKVYEMNGYQFRLKHEESNNLWDWYHTTGTVVMTVKGKPRRWGRSYKTAEDIAMEIKNYVYNNI